MFMSRLLGERLREKPSDASMPSHVFLVRGGYIRSLGSGLYSLLTPAMRIQQKIEKIIREEMEGMGAQEVLLPVVTPSDLWKESGRYDTVDKELLRIKDRIGREMVLAMTHEESMVHLARSELKSHTQFPVTLFQIQTKFRDEPRARGGLIRTREFTMKDAYSFHTSQEDLDEFYDGMLHAYNRIFARVGLPNVIVVASDCGMMGGKAAHEFMLISESGEDTLVVCPKCDYKANLEVAEAEIPTPQWYDLGERREVFTPGITSIETLSHHLNIPQNLIVKAVVLEVDGRRPLVVFLRGDMQVSEPKLSALLKTSVKETSDTQEPMLKLGYIGPCGALEEVCDVIYDTSLKGLKSFVCGANKAGYHTIGAALPFAPTFQDVAKIGPEHRCKGCGEKLQFVRGIEMGNIFKLGDKYTKSMNMNYLDKVGDTHFPIMGCYGIGIGRLIAGLVEEHHDDFGPIWPKNIAPWQVHICPLKLNDPEVYELACKLYDILKEKFEILFDDRGSSAGIQFADADLLGCPVRIVISKKHLLQKALEVSIRGEKGAQLIPFDEIVPFLEKFFEE